MKKLFYAALMSLSLSACGDGTSDNISELHGPMLVGDFVKFEKLNPNILKFLTCPETVSPELIQAESKILEATNAERRRHGLNDLHLDACASKVARAHSANMIAKNYYSHDIDGKGPIERVREANIGFTAVHENIHNAFSQWNNQPTWDVNGYPGSAMGFWTTSAPHRANVLNPNVTHIGIGVAKGQSGAHGLLAGTQVFFRP